MISDSKVAAFSNHQIVLSRTEVFLEKLSNLYNTIDLHLTNFSHY